MTQHQDERPDCGCKIATVNDTFVFQPCSETCDTYAYVVEQIRKQDKPLTHIDTASAMRLPSALCPYCGAKNDRVTADGGGTARPQPGNLSVCAYCIHVGVFTANGIRRSTPEEEAEYRDDPQLVAMLKTADTLRTIRRPASTGDAHEQ